MEEHDPEIRWHQRFSSFQKALVKLEEAIALSQIRDLSNLEKQGTIQAFEFTHEMAWKTLQDLFKGQGVSPMLGSRDATRAAFRTGLIVDGETWMNMIRSRNLGNNSHQEEITEELYSLIVNSYYQAFKALAENLQSIQPATS